MASIPKASTILFKICLLFITAIKIAAADRRSVLTDLYKQAAEQNRPLILVVDNHSKDKGQRNQGHGVYKGSDHVSDEAIPLHYMYPKSSVSSSKSAHAQERNSESKIDLIKYYLSSLLSQSQSGLYKKSGRSDDRDDDLNLDNRDYRTGRVHRDRYRERNTDAKYNRIPSNRFHRPKESREIKYNANRPENRDRYDRDRYDRDRRDRYRSDRDREDRYRVDRYRSEKDRSNRDRADRYREDRNRDRDHYGDRYRYDRDRYQSQYKYQSPQSQDRYSDNYGASVIKNLLRYSNDLNCEAKNRCKGKCYQRARLLRQKGDNCEDICDEKFECDESEEKEEEVEKNDGCDGRGPSGESCGDEKNDNMSTKGYTDNSGEQDECNERGC